VQGRSQWIGSEVLLPQLWREFVNPARGVLSDALQHNWLKFEVRKVEASHGRPHGLSYSFTLHGPDNRRLVGFDNAHGVPAKGRFKKRSRAMDHWHRTQTDEGRPYAFKDAEKLISDFFAEVERVLTERGVPFEVVDVTEGDPT
jgi:hypothetical protein